MARGKVKAKHDDLVEALDGMFDDHHGELAGMLLEQIAFPGDRIARLSARASRAGRGDTRRLGHQRGRDHRPARRHRPGRPVLNAVARLAQLPGIREDQARTIIAETGLDMSRFPTAARLVHLAAQRVAAQAEHRDPPPAPGDAIHACAPLIPGRHPQSFGPRPGG